MDEFFRLQATDLCIMECYQTLYHDVTMYTEITLEFNLPPTFC